MGKLRLLGRGPLTLLDFINKLKILGNGSSGMRKEGVGERLLP
jgi:hypothetical protein